METEGVAQTDSIHLCLHVFPILPVYLVSKCFEVGSSATQDMDMSIDMTSVDHNVNRSSAVR